MISIAFILLWAPLFSEDSGTKIYWNARCLENRKEACALYQEVVENHPDCPYAAEAAFSLFTPEQYVYGEQAAETHLHSITQRFPTSYLSATCCYLLALRTKSQPQSSVEYLHDCIQQCDALLEQEQPPHVPAYLHQLRQRALIDAAWAYLSLADVHPSLVDLAKITFRTLLDERQEEALHGLIQSYRASEEPQQAWEVWERYSPMLPARPNVHLARACACLGALSEGDPTRAIECYQLALRYAHERCATADERLGWIIAVAAHHRQLGAVEESLCLLSSVVNSEEVSSQRLRATLLRSELYEEQGRHDLAFRQLISLAEKGGRFAALAEAKLEEQYAYRMD